MSFIKEVLRVDKEEFSSGGNISVELQSCEDLGETSSQQDKCKGPEKGKRILA